MAHAVFTIVSPVHRDRTHELREVLAAIERDPERNPYLRFRDFPAIHFSSFTVFPDDEGRDTLLVFEHNVDLSMDAHLEALTRQALPGLTTIYRCCADFPTGEVDGVALKRYLKAHCRTPHLFHVGTPYRRADNIRAERELRRFLDLRADALSPPRSGQAAEIWRALRTAASVPDGATRDHVPDVDWEKGSVSWHVRPEPRWPTRLVHWGIAAILGLSAIVLVGWLASRAWESQTGLTMTLVALSAGLGVWTAVLLGWPVKGRWRDPLNILIWFGALGWIVSLLPALTDLAGLQSPWRWLGPLLLAIVYVLVFAQLVGRWALPTPMLDRPQPDPALLARVRAQEDRDVNNHMSAMVQLRPGLYRRLALHAVLWSLKWTWFQTVLRDISRGRLFTFATVHFAQWVVLDDKRYLFLSNYDHSWSRYLDDFGYITFGLARLWGQGRRSPGLGSLEHFKDFSRSWMEPHAVWYRAYPDTSVTQIWNNEKLRLGLLEDADETRSRELLARLVASEDR
jgi:hypothetical protein